MMDGTLTTVDGRRALRFERRLDHSVQRVWRAVSEPDELARWFVAPVAWTPALGETFGGEGGTGQITELEPPRLLGWTWEQDRFRFELEPEGDGCMLIFTHVFDERRGTAAQHAAGWEAYLERLAAHLTGRELSEERAHDPFAELHERYAERFGDDPAPGRCAVARMSFRDLTLGDGPVLRLERRYRHPVERVWRALTEPEELANWFVADAPMEVVQRVPPSLLTATWFGDALRFELRPDGEGCVLVFTHVFAQRETAARTAAGWDRCFARLDALFAGRPMSERAALEAWPIVHERYAQTFGVDPEIGRSAYAQRPLS